MLDSLEAKPSLRVREAQGCSCERLTSYYDFRHLGLPEQCNEPKRFDFIAMV